jgi:3',5'-nucleoside bisphosphate phosphatase
MKIDLHLHTTYSDGIFSPEELLEMACKHDYDVISITDHDTLDGYREAKRILEKFPVKIIPGIEISSIYQHRDVHLLAYDIDVEHEELDKLLTDIQKSRLIRAKKIIDKLKTMGIFVDFERVRSLSGKHDLIARPHIARVLVENGNCRSTKEAFDNYLGNASPAYVLKQTPSVQEIIDVIHRAGGVVVLAHPHTLFDDSFIDDFVMMGLDGLEAFYAKYDKIMVDYYDEIAQKNGLLRTGGSDFHGEMLDFDYFGEYSAPHFVLEEIKLWSERYK